MKKINLLILGITFFLAACDGQQHKTYTCGIDAICNDDGPYLLKSTRQPITGTVIEEGAGLRMVMQVKNGKDISGKVYTSNYGLLFGWEYVNGKKIRTQYR